MKELIVRHYNAIKKRGYINSYTALEDFRDKLLEEIQEFWDADRYEYVIDGDMAQEAIDVVGVIFNMLIHYGYDIEAEFRYNVERQEERSLN